MELIADTGNPYAIIISEALMDQLRERAALDLTTNFGPMSGGWVRVVIPEVGFDQMVLGYASDKVVTSTRGSSADFNGLAGLPLLRQLEYGGDDTSFWIRALHKGQTNQQQH